MQETIKFKHGFILIAAALITILVFQFVAADTETETATNDSLPEYVGPTAITIDGSLKNATNPVVASSPTGDTVMVAYKLQTATDHDIYFRKSTDNGSSWTPQNPIADTINVNSSDVDIDFDSVTNRAHAVWIENSDDLNYARENADGSWTVKANVDGVISNPSFPQILTDPKIFASGNKIDIVLVYQTDTGSNPDIYHTRSVSRGGFWPLPTPIINDGAFITESPDLFVDGDTIHVVWHEKGFDATNRHVVYVVGTWSDISDSVTWEEKVDLSHTTPGDKFAINPQITITDNVIHVTYTEQNLTIAEPEDEQYIYHISCSLLTDDCLHQNDWESHGQISKRLGANTGSPGSVQSTINGNGNCLLVYYHGVKFDPTDANWDESNELIWGNSNCGGEAWTTNGESALINSDNVQLIRPDIDIQNDTFAYLVYEKDDSNGTSQIQFMRSEPLIIGNPIIYLPIIFRQ